MQAHEAFDSPRRQKERGGGRSLHRLNRALGWDDLSAETRPKYKSRLEIEDTRVGLDTISVLNTQFKFPHETSAVKRKKELFVAPQAPRKPNPLCLGLWVVDFNELLAGRATPNQ